MNDSIDQNNIYKSLSNIHNNRINDELQIKNISWWDPRWLNRV